MTSSSIFNMRFKFVFSALIIANVQQFSAAKDEGNLSQTANHLEGVARQSPVYFGSNPLFKPPMKPGNRHLGEWQQIQFDSAPKLGGLRRFQKEMDSLSSFEENNNLKLGEEKLRRRLFKILRKNDIRQKFIVDDSKDELKKLEKEVETLAQSLLRKALKRNEPAKKELEMENAVDINSDGDDMSESAVDSSDESEKDSEGNDDDSDNEDNEDNDNDYGSDEDSFNEEYDFTYDDFLDALFSLL